MDETVQVRAAEEEDLPGIVAIWRESMALHGGVDPAFEPRAESHAVFKRFASDQIASADAAVAVAEALGTTVAYGICVLRERSDYFEPDRFGLITDLDVASGWRRKGIGDQVLSFLQEWLGARGVTRVEAEVVSANKLATSFWRKQGFITYYQAMYRKL